MKSVLITGGAGYFGKAFVRRLLDTNAAERVCVYSRNEWNQATMREAFNNDPRLRFFIGDVRDSQRLTHAMRSCELVVHAAALKRVEAIEYNVMEAVATNIIGTENVVTAAIAAGVKRAILISSDKACEPTTTYGMTKGVAEKVFINAKHYAPHGPKFVVCRYGNVAGSTGSVIPIWRRMIEQGVKELPMTDPDCTRFWMSADQAVNLVINAATLDFEGHICIPPEAQVPGYRLADLATALGAKGVRNMPMTDGEKIHERMREGGSDSSQVRRMTVAELKEELSRV